jgi:hypothetical protein
MSADDLAADFPHVKFSNLFTLNEPTVEIFSRIPASNTLTLNSTRPIKLNAPTVEIFSRITACHTLRGALGTKASTFGGISNSHLFLQWPEN